MPSIMEHIKRVPNTGLLSVCGVRGLEKIEGNRGGRWCAMHHQLYGTRMRFVTMMRRFAPTLTLTLSDDDMAFES